MRSQEAEAAAAGEVHGVAWSSPVLPAAYRHPWGADGRCHLSEGAAGVFADALALVGDGELATVADTLELLVVPAFR